MFFQSEWKTVWILIRWLRQKPADLDLQCFQKRINPHSAGQGLIDMKFLTTPGIYHGEYGVYSCGQKLSTVNHST